MEGLCVASQLDFIDSVFELLKKTELVKAGKHYDKDTPNVWDSKFYDKVFDKCIKILDACAE